MPAPTSAPTPAPASPAAPTAGAVPTAGAPGPPDAPALRAAIERAARDLGFDAIGVAGIELGEDEEHLLRWLERGWHGQMGYMSRHGVRRSRPAQLRPGTLRVISARMNYRAAGSRAPLEVLADDRLGYVSRYALGRDYHKLMRRALARLGARIAALAGPHGHRVFVDSAPVLEKALARNAGLGWIGKHTNLIARDAGSWFFLGEIYTDLPLPLDARAQGHCGSCAACIPACPTGAIVAPYQLDARRCISYLTIELAGAIPEALRPAIGNRIYGCDDCQLVCPWNRYARDASHPDFRVRHGLDAPRLTELIGWSAAEFTARMRGSAIHRIGHVRWLRNVAVALGNARTSPQIVAALEAAERTQREPLVREHLQWALARHARHAAPRPDAPAHDTATGNSWA
ncbi:MAG TPA: tRNA epoxyqueuosine(34) reductase QueG [Steroidobacteraceae bacterium]|nr:tRNA epoxyqueuosine(34) reductase QueG [Steroidobacteraceae bacterium]